MVLTGCCCMSLRTAGLVLGWLGLAASAITISSVMNHLSRYEYDPDVTHDDVVYQRHRTLEGDVILLSISIINVLITGLLINGITVNKHRLIVPWLIVKGLSLIVIIPIGFLIVIASLFSAEPFQIVASILLLVIIGFCGWCWMAIYSLYKEIRATSRKTLTFYESAALSGGTVPYQLFEKY